MLSRILSSLCGSCRTSSLQMARISEHSSRQLHELGIMFSAFADRSNVFKQRTEAKIDRESIASHQPQWRNSLMAYLTMENLHKDGEASGSRKAVTLSLEHHPGKYSIALVSASTTKVGTVAHIRQLACLRAQQPHHCRILAVRMTLRPVMPT